MADSDELSLDDDEPTLDIEDDSFEVSDDEPTMEIDEDESFVVSDDEVGSDEEDDGLAPEMESENYAVITEGSSIGAFTAMLIVSFVAYSAALAVVLWNLAKYSTDGAFPWKGM